MHTWIHTDMYDSKLLVPVQLLYTYHVNYMRVLMKDSGVAQIMQVHWLKCRHILHVYSTSRFKIQRETANVARFILTEITDS